MQVVDVVERRTSRDQLATIGNLSSPVSSDGYWEEQILSRHGRSAEPEYSTLTDAELFDDVRQGLREAFWNTVSAKSLVEAGGAAMYPISTCTAVTALFQRYGGTSLPTFQLQPPSTH